MPYWGCLPTIRRAVQSVLAQTYRDLILVVINDGGGHREWRTISDIDDRRLIRFDLQKNHGRYYADAVTLQACDTPWFSVHDADDWSEPEWLEELISRAVETDSVAAFAPQVLHRGAKKTIEQVHRQLETRDVLPGLTQLAHHAGVYRTEILRAAGGYHPAYRIGYDTMVVDLVRLLGPCAVSPNPRYHRVTRFGSLTMSRQTGFGTAARAAVKEKLIELYKLAVNINPNGLASLINGTIPNNIKCSVSEDAGQLRKLINDHR